MFTTIPLYTLAYNDYTRNNNLRFLLSLYGLLTLNIINRITIDGLGYHFTYIVYKK